MWPDSLSTQNVTDVQNLAEAEYCVAVFMYMRLIGYPADKVSILTTYNGQKHLIRDVINIRCATNPLIGRPHKVHFVVCVNCQ
jgi:intron-binding protein aquarius